MLDINSKRIHSSLELPKDKITYNIKIDFKPVKEPCSGIHCSSATITLAVSHQPEDDISLLKLLVVEKYSW